MKTKHIFSTVPFFLILLVFPSQSVLSNMAPAFGATNNASVRRALLIGIGKYEVLPRLPGSKNDIDLVHQVLVSRYGFSEKNVRDVRDKEVLSLPMSANLKALESLAQVMMQSRNASQLLALENPATQINMDVRVVQVGQRRIAVVSDRMEAPVYHIRQAGERSSMSNSL